ncbi:MAG: hypothetical protein DHS20C18_12540 [Saprospiraceae bacterium]|nr:MAG: hypothetical protein DHS20C18_12540 [Saprospiraceae bacterium]
MNKLNNLNLYMKKLYLIILVFFILSGLQAQVASVQFIHNSPTPGSVSGQPIDVYLNGNLLPQLTALEFRQATPYLPIAADSLISLAIAISPSTSIADTLVSFDVGSFSEDNYYTIMATGILGDPDQPFNLFINENARITAEDPTTIDVSFFHGGLDIPSFSVTDYATTTELLADLSYGYFSDNISVDPTAHVFEIRPANTENLTGSFFINLTGEDSLAAVVFASGAIAAEPTFNLFAAFPDGTVLPFVPAVQAQLIHNSPLPAAEVIDIYMGGNLILDDFSFRQATPFEFFASRTPITLGVAPDNSDGPEDVLFNLGPITFEDGKLYSLIANGIPFDPNFPFELVVNEQAHVFSEDPAKTDVTVFHGAPGTPNIDISIRDEGGLLVDDLEYGVFTAYLPLESENYYLEIHIHDDSDLVGIFNTDIQGLNGIAGTVFTSGILDGQPTFGLFMAFPNGLVVPLNPISRVQLIHNAPGPTLDIYINGVLSIEGFDFHEALPFIDFPAREPLDLAVTLAGEPIENAVEVFEDVVFETGDSYILMVSGIVDDPENALDLVVYDQGRERSESGVDLLFYQGSPDAPLVDVVAEETSTVLFDNMAFGQYNGYVNHSSGSTLLNITPAENNATIVRQYEADLATFEGEALTLFASGFLQEDEVFPFELWVARANGESFPLTEIVGTNDLGHRLKSFQLGPNPAVSQVHANFELTEAVDMKFLIYNSFGQLLFIKDLGTLSQGHHRESLPVDTFPAGTYQCLILSSMGMAAFPLMIAN